MQAILDGNPPIEVTMRRSARAQRISLRISGLDGRVTLTIPGKTSAREAMTFARTKEPWLREHLARQMPAMAVVCGAHIPVEDRLREIRHEPGRRARITTEAIEVSQPHRAGGETMALLKAAARNRLMEASEAYCQQLGVTMGRLTLRDTRSRWGSCTSAGDLMFSWRLIMAPAPILRYVAAHEVSHLQRMDHSPAFWAIVEQIDPDFAQHRRWLGKHGASLHRYRFTD